MELLLGYALRIKQLFNMSSNHCIAKNRPESESTAAFSTFDTNLLSCEIECLNFSQLSRHTPMKFRTVYFFSDIPKSTAEKK